MQDPNFAPTAAAVAAALSAQGLMRHIGAEIDEIAQGRVVLSLPRRAEVMQQHGFFHGGAIAFLIDNATTAAAGTLIDRETQSCLTAEYKLNILAPATGERLVCTASVLKTGRKLTIVEAKVHSADKAGPRLVAAALATIANIDKPKG